MDEKDLIFEETLADSERMLKSTARELDDDAEFSLESILAEYGEERADRARSEQPSPSPAPREAERAAETEAAPEDDEPDDAALEAPQALSLDEVLRKTVQGALDERADEIIEEAPRRRGLFSRRRVRDTEQLYDDEPRAAEREEADEPDEPELPDEPPAEDTAAAFRAQHAAAKKALRLTGIITVLLWVWTALWQLSLLPQEYFAQPLAAALPCLVLEMAACVAARRVFSAAWGRLRAFRFCAQLITVLLCAVTLADTAFYSFSPARAVLPLPLAGLGALALCAALLGETLYARGMYDTFRIVAIGGAPYIVTLTAGGAAKRSGDSAGFTTCARMRDPYGRWQEALLPVILMAALLFGVLATVEGRNAALLLWELSLLLASADLLAFPLVSALPYARIAARLARSGSAVAGYAGADAIRRSNCVILTDGDLFPPGTVTLGGLKVFGEESGKVISYAATMAHASESGLSRLFDNLLESDGGTLEELDALNFHEEGGVSGRIHGETVLFGTVGFFRRQGVALPRGITLKTGVFLAVDGTLIAVFAVKYLPAENVDWALHALHHSRITPVLAVRDGNITPALLKRKFGTDARAIYPKLETRLALSERSGGRPCAVLMREGLMPYAEVVLGSKRLCRCARRGTAFSLLASVAGLLIAFYLAFSGRYDVLTPVSVLVYVLLWSLSVLVDGAFSDRY